MVIGGTSRPSLIVTWGTSFGGPPCRLKGNNSFVETSSKTTIRFLRPWLTVASVMRLIWICLAWVWIGWCVTHPWWFNNCWFTSRTWRPSFVPDVWIVYQLSLFLFGIYALLECRTHDTQERWQLLLLSQTVKLSGWSHGPSHALSHDRVHVPPPDYDSPPLVTHHVAGLYLLIYQPHSLISRFAQPHFWLVVLIFIVSHTSGWTPHFPLVLPIIIALPQLYLWLVPHTHSSLSIYPYHYQACTNMVCAPWSVRTPSSYISL